MSRFSDYESSHITPQMTLLKKLNEILKYLREIDVESGTRIYKHKLQIENMDPIIIHSTISRPFESGIDVYNNLNHIIEDLKSGFCYKINSSGFNCISISSQGYFDDYLYDFSGHLAGGTVGFDSDEIVGEL